MRVCSFSLFLRFMNILFYFFTLHDKPELTIDRSAIFCLFIMLFFCFSLKKIVRMLHRGETSTPLDCTFFFPPPHNDVLNIPNIFDFSIFNCCAKKSESETEETSWQFYQENTRRLSLSLSLSLFFFCFLFLTFFCCFLEKFCVWEENQNEKSLRKIAL